MTRVLPAALALSLAACQGRTPPGPALPESFTAVDDRAPAPRRVVCLVPSATELVFALGAGDRVVAHFVGAVALSGDVRTMLHGLCRELCRRYALPFAVPAALPALPLPPFPAADCGPSSPPHR